MSNPFASSSPVITQQAPEVRPPPTMPDPLSPDALAAKRRAEQDVMGRAGRSSTILSSAMSRGEPSATYSASKLGAAT